MKKLEFYKNQYYEELERKKEIDSYINYPTTLITILIGGIIYLLDLVNYDFCNIFKSTQDIIETIFLIVLIVMLLLSIAQLLRMFVNVFKKYKYLPSPQILKEWLSSSINHFVQEGYSKKKSVKKADNFFEKQLICYYIECGNFNQWLNDKRTKIYYKARLFIVISLILASLLSISLILN